MRTDVMLKSDRFLFTSRVSLCVLVLFLTAATVPFGLETTRSAVKGEQDAFGMDKASQAAGDECPPSWYPNSPDRPGYLVASATATSKRLDRARDRATFEARVELARQLELWVETVQEDIFVEGDEEFRDEFRQVSKAVSKVELQGSKPVAMQICAEEQQTRAYAMVEYPLEKGRDAVLSEMKNNPVISPEVDKLGPEQVKKKIDDLIIHGTPQIKPIK